LTLCVKLFQNPWMHDRVTVWTCLLCNWEHMVGQTDMSFSRDTSFWCGRHLCQVILKSFHVWQSYNPDINVCTYKLLIKWNFKMLVWLDLWGRDVIHGRDKLSLCGKHLCQIILKSFNVWQS
jgi:hypothetical protein